MIYLPVQLSPGSSQCSCPDILNIPVIMVIHSAPKSCLIFPPLSSPLSFRQSLKYSSRLPVSWSCQILFFFTQVLFKDSACQLNIFHKIHSVNFLTSFFPYIKPVQYWITNLLPVFMPGYKVYPSHLDDPIQLLRAVLFSNHCHSLCRLLDIKYSSRLPVLCHVIFFSFRSAPVSTGLPKSRLCLFLL